jgi:hypothetical protein
MARRDAAAEISIPKVSTHTTRAPITYVPSELKVDVGADGRDHRAALLHGCLRNLRKKAANTKTIPTFAISRSQTQSRLLKNRRSKAMMIAAITTP